MARMAVRPPKTTPSVCPEFFIFSLKFCGSSSDVSQGKGEFPIEDQIQEVRLMQ